MKRNTAGTTPSIRLLGNGVDDELMREAIACKAIAAMMASPKVKLCSRAFAKKLGCTEQQVLHVLNQPAFVEIIRDHVRVMGMGSLSQDMAILEEIRNDENVRPADRIAAIRAKATVYDTILKVVPAAQEGEAAEKMQQIIKQARGVAIELNERKQDDEHRDQRPNGNPGEGRRVSHPDPAPQEDHRD